MSPLPSTQPSPSRCARALIAPATVFLSCRCSASAATPTANKRQRPYKTPLAFAATPLAMPISISTTPLQSTMTDIMVGVAAAAAGVVLGRLTSTRSGNGGGDPPCERCAGSGKIDCEMCKRWDYSAVSNGGQKQGANINKAAARNVHCASCHGSLRTRCPRCRGGGTAAPILGRLPVPVRIDEGFNSLRRFAQQTLMR